MLFIRLLSVGLVALASKALGLPELKKPSLGRDESPLPSLPAINAFPVFDHHERRFSMLNRLRYRPGYLNCPCSASSRGYSTTRVMPNGGEKLLALDSLVGWPPTNWKEVRFVARKVYDKCVTEHGHEACVNWDYSRVFSGRFGLCAFDLVTQKNVVNVTGDMVRTVGPCNNQARTMSPMLSLRNFEQFVNSSLAKGDDSDGLFEGCVDVRHLVGAGTLLHPVNLRRNVLCLNTFCATPNHAIIWHGKWTSLGRLCAHDNTCVDSVAWVNNLRVFTTTRWEVQPGITITPYDVRIPIVATWFLQAVEILLSDIVASMRLLLRTTNQLRSSRFIVK